MKTIIGNVTSSTARIWIRSEKEQEHATIQIADENGAVPSQSKQVELPREGYYTGIADFTGLKPGTVYKYAATTVPPTAESIDGEFSTFPKEDTATPFSFLLCSCNLHSDDGFKAVPPIIQERKPAFIIHCGDQIYADVPLAGSIDVDHYRGLYERAWNEKSIEKVLRSIPNYMVLDDHEIVNDFANDQDYTFIPDNRLVKVKRAALQAYREFQHSHNPDSPDTGSYYYSFQHGNVHFFVLDTRTERYIEKKENHNQMISRTQMQNLIEWMKLHKDEIKFIVSSIPFVAELRDNEDKWSGKSFIDQREFLLFQIKENNVKRVIFLTGDMHNACHSRLTILTDSGNIDVHEIMASPISQMPVALGKMSEYHTEKVRENPSFHLRYFVQLDADKFYSGDNIGLVSVQDETVSFKVMRADNGRQAFDECNFTV